MPSTSESLLDRVRSPGDAAGWERFVRLYTPLLLFWARRLGLSKHDADDLVQDVFAKLLLRLPEFRYEAGRSFRGWLRTLLINSWKNQAARHRPTVADHPVPDALVPDPAEEVAEAEYRNHLVARALELMQADFQPATWKACWEFAVLGRPATDVADELGITINAVYLAKSRVLARLRQELAGLLD